jgi:Zn-dependent peptidase ImmA (M78 family)
MYESFDEGLWLKRIERRKDKKHIKRDRWCVRSIGKLIEWLKIRSIIVVFVDDDRNGAYYNILREIDIYRYASLERQLFILLHELGHHTIDTSKSKNASRTAIH